MSGVGRLRHVLPALPIALTAAAMMGSAPAQEDPRLQQLKLLCVQLSGDLTEPGGMAAFQRCLNTHDPLGEIRRNNNIGGGAAPDRPDAAPPGGFGRNSRRLVAEGIDRFQQVPGNLLYVVDRAGKLWRATADGKNAQVVDENVAAFEAIDGRLFVQRTDGALSRARLDGAERTNVDRAVAAFQPVNAGLIYVLGADGRLWRENGDFSRRTEVDRTVRSFQAIDATGVLVLDGDQQLWREAGTRQSRTFVASKITAFQYVQDGDTVYVQTSDGTLWRKTANDPPQQIDSAVAAFRALDSQVVYVLGSDGRLWRERGGRDRAVLVDRDVLAGPGRITIQVIDPGHVLLLDNQHKLWAESMPESR
jgi:hypothetical protein